jgi:hypothetical protein
MHLLVAGLFLILIDGRAAISVASTMVRAESFRPLASNTSPSFVNSAAQCFSSR